MDENDFYSNDINSYMYNMQAIEDANYPYVVLTPSHFVFRQDFSALLDTHIESGADITMLYQNVDNAKESFVNCDVVNLNKQKGVLSLEKNRGNSKSRTISLETYILSKELFMDLVKKAANISSLYWFRDIVNDECAELDIRGVAHRGFVACINDFKSYYNANMDLLDYDKAMDLFHTDWPVYTRTNDSCPTQYYAGVSVKNSMVSNGCLVEGDIENSVIGRGAIIKKGAVVKNCVILPAGIESGFIHSIACVSRAIVVTTLDVTALQDADRIIGILMKEGMEHISFIVNRMNVHHMDRGISVSLEEAKQWLSIDFLGYVFDDENMMRSNNHGKPIVLQRETQTYSCFDSIVRRMLGQRCPLPKYRERKFLQKLFG